MSDPRSREPRGWIAAVALAAMLALVGGALWSVWPEGGTPAPPNAAAALERSRDHVGEARTTSFEVEAVWRHPPLADLDGALIDERYAGVVTVAFPGQSASRLDAGPYLRDRVFDGEIAYGREGDTQALLDAEPWRPIDLRTDELSSRRTFFDRPAFLPTLLADSTDPVILADVDGRVDVRVTVAGSGALQFLPDRSFDEAQAILTLTHGGRPEQIHITARQPGQFEAILTFSAWDEATRVAVPTDIDNAPLHDEAEITQYAEHTLYLPTQVPPGWEILAEGALRPDESGLDCRSAQFRIGTPSDGTGTDTTTTTASTSSPTTTAPSTSTTSTSTSTTTTTTTTTAPTTTTTAPTTTAPPSPSTTPETAAPSATEPAATEPTAPAATSVPETTTTAAPTTTSPPTTTTTTTRPSTTTTGPTTTTVPAATTTTAPAWPTAPTEMVLVEHLDTCANPIPLGAQRLEAGRFDASVVERLDGRLAGGLTVDGVAVRFETDLDRASLSRLLASLSPVEEQEMSSSTTTGTGATTATTATTGTGATTTTR